MKFSNKDLFGKCDQIRSFTIRNIRKIQGYLRKLLALLIILCKKWRLTH